jgi:uncharacterized protein YrzB (UPF0473 family)
LIITPDKPVTRDNFVAVAYNALIATYKTPNEETNVITLEFEDGTEQECVIIGVFGYNGKDYIALDPDDGTGDAYIYGYKEVGDDEFELIDIEDEAEFEAAAKEFDDIIKG